MVILHSPRCLDYAAAGHPESPERVRTAVAQLQKEFHMWRLPVPCADEDILRVHTPELLEAVRRGTFVDADTPAYPEIYGFAKLSAGAAIGAAEAALADQPAFSVMRPPGHHAERDHVMGFCYLNNIAIAVAWALHSSPAIQRVAILDFDCHHGNGTEDIFRGDERVLFVSLHQSPCYPGTGLTAQGNCLDYPLPPGTRPEQFLAALDVGLNRIRDFQPDLLAVSAGFDAYKNDPITSMGLEIESFYEIGRRIAAVTRAASSTRALPCFAVLEGGYSREFAPCVEAFVNGWERH
jgi:acetoin utilization deacetylase AcuC-like enzyme